MSQYHSQNPWKLPNHWKWAAIKDIGQVVSGGTPSTKFKEYWNGTVNWISPADLSGFNGKYIARGAKSISQIGLDNSSAKLLPKGALLFSSRAPVGYVAIAAEPLATNQGFKNLVPRPGLDPEYLYYYLKASKDLAEARASGTTFKELSGKAFSQLPVAIPPFSEQRRIVTKIEELFSELDKGVESLKTARAQLKTYRQSLLKAAFEGRLTEQWRRDNAEKLETADQLLQRIRDEREARYEQQLEEWNITIKEWETGGRASKKPRKPSLLKGAEPFSSEELSSLPELPNGWTWVPYSALCESIRNGISKAPEDGKGDKIFRISAVRPMAFDMEDFRRIDNSSGEFDDYSLTRGDIVFTRYNGSRNYVGVAAVFRSNEPYLYPDKLIRTRIQQEFVSPDYLEAAVNTGESRRFTESRIRTTAGQSGISGGDIKRIPVPLCSYEEQVFIADLLNSGLSRIQDFERSIEAAYRRSESLRQSVLKRAFEGNLVPQDPDDEPASVLLERIRAEQEEAPKPRGRRRKSNV